MRAGDDLPRRSLRRPVLLQGEILTHATYEACLSDELLAAISTVDRDTELHDTFVDGLYVRIRPTGSITFWYLDPFERGSSRRKFRLGSVNDFTVDQARLKALAVSEARFTVEGSVRTHHQIAKSTCVSEAWGIYRDEALPPKAYGRIERLLRPYLTEYSDARPTAARRASLLRMIEKVALEDPNQGYEFHKHLRAFLSWCVRSGLIDANPISFATMPARRQRRNKILKVSELAQVYQASVLLSSPSRELVGVLLLTGAGIEVARCMRRDQIDFQGRSWTPPHGGSEGNAPVRPLGNVCLEILLKRPVNQTYFFQSPHRPFPPSPIHLSRSALDKLRTGSGADLRSWRDLTQSVRLAIGHVRDSKQHWLKALESERAALDAWAVRLTTSQSGAEEDVDI